MNGDKPRKEYVIPEIVPLKSTSDHKKNSQFTSFDGLYSSTNLNKGVRDLQNQTKIQFPINKSLSNSCTNVTTHTKFKKSAYKLSTKVTLNMDAFAHQSDKVIRKHMR